MHKIKNLPLSLEIEKTVCIPASFAEPGIDKSGLIR